ncbi:MAG: ABC transporter permease [Chitinispirillaceae bacterium]|nr:ABC transporter permease [Chitinispirillaceae bacterium]
MAGLRYLISEGGRGLFQAKLMTVVSIITIAVVLLIACVVTVVMINVWTHLRGAIERADFVVYCTETAASDPGTVDELAATLRSLPEVRTIRYVDKEAARRRFVALYGSDMLDAVDENPLPASLEITLAKAHQSSNAAARLKERLAALPGVEGVRYAREWIDFLERVQRWFVYAVIALAVAMVTTLHITISNTIKLTIYARSDLVRTMALVGATPFFISMPFIIEGMLQGLIGGVIGVALFYGIKTVFMVEPTLRQMQFVWGPSLLPLLFPLLGVLFGWIGSFFAVRKFMAR